MLGAPVFRTALFGPWSGNALWTAARAVPSLDRPFADSKSLVDAITGRQLISYARAGSGAYTDSAGVLQTAATDVPRFDHRITSTTTNLAIRSEEFDNATWVQTGLNAFGSGSVANAIAAPDGTVTGDLIEEDTSTGFHRVSQTLISGTVSTGTYTASVYVKAAQRSRAHISLDDNATGEVTAGFALLTQAFNITTAGSWSGSAASIEDVGDGWFRISLTSTKGDGSSALTLRVGIAQVSTTTISYTGNGASGLYVWGAQLVASDSNGRYVRTTAAAASVSTTESLGLLVEEQRTNLLVRSEEFNDASWGKSLSSVSANSTNSPASTQTADALVEDTSNGEHQITGVFTVTSGTIYTVSIYVKAAGRTFCRFGFTGTGFSGPTRSSFNLATGAVTANNGGSPTITPVGSGWYRLSVTNTATSTTTGSFIIQPQLDASTLSYTGDGTSGIYLWGAQLEAGATASSYILTTTAAATRNADVAQITGTNFSSWYRQDEGTMFAQYNSTTWNADANFPKSFAIGTDDSNGFWIGGDTADNVYRYRVRNGGVNQFGAATIPRTTITNNKTAIAVKASDFAVAADGGNLATGTTGSVPAATSMSIGSDLALNINFANQPIKRLTYWPQRLDNATLQAITQP